MNLIFNGHRSVALGLPAGFPTGERYPLALNSEFYESRASKAMYLGYILEGEKDVHWATLEGPEDNRDLLVSCIRHHRGELRGSRPVCG